MNKEIPKWIIEEAEKEFPYPDTFIFTDEIEKAIVDSKRKAYIIGRLKSQFEIEIMQDALEQLLEIYGGYPGVGQIASTTLDKIKGGQKQIWEVDEKDRDGLKKAIGEFLIWYRNNGEKVIGPSTEKMIHKYLKTKQHQPIKKEEI